MRKRRSWANSKKGRQGSDRKGPVQDGGIKSQNSSPLKSPSLGGRSSEDWARESAEIDRNSLSNTLDGFSSCPFFYQSFQCTLQILPALGATHSGNSQIKREKEKPEEGRWIEKEEGNEYLGEKVIEQVCWKRMKAEISLDQQIFIAFRVWERPWTKCLRGSGDESC